MDKFVIRKLPPVPEKEILSQPDAECSSAPIIEPPTPSSSYNEHLQSHPDDPTRDVPTDRLERADRLARGPFQPKLGKYATTVIGNKSRQFQPKWYSMYDWLEYSPNVDAAFCMYCRFFSTNDSSNKGHTDKAFVSTGFKSWNRATESFRVHQGSTCHIQSSKSFSSFMSSEEKSIDVLLNQQREDVLTQKQVEKENNRKVMERLIDIVVCLAKSGHSFRGHREKENDLNKGLFLSLVDLLKKYDPVMKRHLEEAPRNASYTSNHIQNDLITALHNIILRNIVASVHGKKISLIADETSDVGHTEQMSVVIRFFDEDKNCAVERFICLQSLTKQNANSVFQKLNDVLTGFLKMDWTSVISVCFDGASTMSGCNNGVQAKCKEMRNEIMFVHCYAHCLNLVLVDACTSSTENRAVFNFFGIVQTLYCYLEGSTLRHAVFTALSKEAGSKLTTLKSLSTTRWACRAEAVKSVKANFDVIIDALQEIISTTDKADATIKGRGLLHEMKSFDFVLALEITHPILTMILKVSQTLQCHDIDLLTAVKSVQMLKESLSTLRDETSFKEIFNVVKETCEKIGVEIPDVKKRKVSSRIDGNTQTTHYFESKEDQDRCLTFYPFLDSLIRGIDERFDQETCNLIVAVGKILKLEANVEDLKIISKNLEVDFDGIQAEQRLLQNSKMSDGAPPKGTELHNY